MSKQQEIEALRAFVNSLPASSYLGHWLLSVMDEIERDIRCDIIPAPVLPGAAAKAGAAIVEHAKQAASEIEAQASRAIAVERARFVAAQNAFLDRTAGLLDAARAQVLRARA